MACFNEVVSAVSASMALQKCIGTGPGAACLVGASPAYAIEVDKVLAKGFPSDTVPCSEGRPWTPQMEYAANILMQRAATCKMDSTIMMALMHRAHQMAQRYALCGLTVPSAAPLATASARLSQASVAISSAHAAASSSSMLPSAVSSALGNASRSSLLSGSVAPAPRTALPAAQ